MKIEGRFSDIHNLKFMALLDSEKCSLNIFISLKQSYGQYFYVPKLNSELSIISASYEFSVSYIYKF